ncbi:LacI family DNA-binding transcriptional regulator [Cohnella luojiensis]|uniref:LacI family transcriptional regulator n=1 Tax=Cohnella luojiensis TaxID=652876 RepID=A0A4Y8M4X1_9BACL|nr:LacI family DNA-binding transcriptional regulator [Cohnella luojiensis]TFE29517.1 LacI family transcriptional regulator [Cohnella luojiensis]
MKKNLTINDISRMAGISIRTVSRVINKDPKVKVSTREQVQKIIDDTGFEVNILAKGLRVKRTNTLVVFVAQHEDHYWGAFHNEILYEMMKEAKRRNYRLVISSSSAESYKEDVNDGFYMLKHGMVDGAVMFDIMKGDPRTTFLRNKKIPFVIIGKDLDYFDTSYVDLDNRYAGFLGAQYLVSRGRKRIVFMVGNQEFNNNPERAAGFLEFFQTQEAIKNKAVGQTISRVHSIRIAYEETKRILDDPNSDQPDAFFVSGDERALGVYRAVQEKGLKIPEDVAVLGIDNIRMGEYFHPPITTIDQSIPSFVENSFNILFKQLENSEAPGKRVLITPVIQERRSV